MGSREFLDDDQGISVAIGMGIASVKTREGPFSTASVMQRLQAMRIRDRPIAPCSPCQNGYIERAIGSIRRECLDHVVVFGTAYLRRSLAASCAYYSGIRTHLSLGKGAPISRLVQSVGRVAAILVLGGLHHHYVRMALTIQLAAAQQLSYAIPARLACRTLSSVAGI